MQQFQNILSQEFDLRRQTDPSYSVRAFARLLELSPATVSQLLSGKRPLSAKAALKIATRLNFSKQEQDNLLRTTLPASTQLTHLTPERYQLDSDRFKLISDWYHYAILGLAGFRRNKACAHWIANKLGISRTEAEEALRRLVRLQLIKITGTSFRQCVAPLSTTEDIPSSAIRKFHAQTIANASRSLQQDSVSERDFSAIMINLNSKDLTKIKELLRNTRRSIAEATKTKNCDRVYTLAIQLFPVSKIEDIK